MEPQAINLRIIGPPIAKGRHKSRIVRAVPPRKDFIQNYAPASNKQWKKDIIKQVRTKAPCIPWTGPIRCDREYIMPRPKCHAKTKYHTVKPDIDNLDKALFDALQGLFFIGDQQICEGIHIKRYTNSWEEPGVIVKFMLLEG